MVSAISISNNTMLSWCQVWLWIGIFLSKTLFESQLKSVMINRNDMRKTDCRKYRDVMLQLKLSN